MKRTVAVVTIGLLLLAVGIRVRWPSDRESSDIDHLIAAVGDRRFVDGRLSRGFRLGEGQPSFRSSGSGDNRDLEVLAVAASLQRLADSRGTPDDLHNWGVAQLALASWDGAVETLGKARVVSSDPPAALLNDLSVAYAARAKSSGRAIDWVEAVSAAESALRKVPAFPEASFNLAVSLEGLGLSEQARESWKRYEEIDIDSEWRKEALRRTLLEEGFSYEADRRWLESSQGDIRTIAERNPGVVRDWIEEIVLPRWADSCRVAPDTSSRQLELAESSAALVGARQHDAYLHQILSEISSRPSPCQVAPVVSGYVHGRTLYLAGKYVDAAREFSQVVESPLTPSPLKSLADFYRALVPYFQGQFEQTGNELRRMRKGSAASMPLLQARIRWMLGIIAVGQGNYLEAREHYRASLAMFEKASDSEGIAQTNNLLAEVLRDMGDERWWDHLVVAQRMAPQVRPQRRHAFYLNAVQGALITGHPEIARRFQRSVQRNARELQHPSLLAESLQWEFILRQHSASGSTTDDVLEAARREVEALPDSGFRQRVAAELAALEAEASVTANPRRAIEQADLAIDFFTGEGRQRRLPLLYLTRAKALIKQGGLDSALADLTKGLRLLETQGQRLSATARATFADERWQLLEATVALLAKMQPDGREALHLLDGYRSSSSGFVRAATQLSSAVPESVGLIQYLALEDQLLVWSVSSGVTRFRTVNVGRDALFADIGRFKSAIRANRGDDEVEQSLRRFAELAVWPVLEDLRGLQLLIVVPDGAIGEVPFAALPLPSAGRLLDRFQLASSTSFRAALEWLTPANSQASSRRTTLVAAVTRAGGAPSLKPLPAARNEGDTIAGVYSDRRAILLREATAAQFRRSVAEADVVHFAGHATLAARFPYTGTLHFAADPGGEEGISSDGLSTLDLHGTRLVVLAACDSAGGLPTRSAGLLGLSSALLTSGAASVLGSLWRVEDEQTAPFMVAFHKRIRNGEQPAAALRNTQREASLQARSSVSQWSAWVLFVGARDLTTDVRQTR